MIRTLAIVLALAGCWRNRAEPGLANRVEPTVKAESSPYLITRRGAGPFTATTVANETALQKLVPRFRVTARDLGEDHGYTNIVFDIFEGDERLYYVVPDDAPDWNDAQDTERRYAETMFAVFAVSPKIKVRGRRWVVGTPFDDADGLDVCECWGANEVTACYERNTHLKVIFEQPCADGDRVEPRALIGSTIARIMWKRALDGGPDVEPIDGTAMP